MTTYTPPPRLHALEEHMTHDEFNAAAARTQVRPLGQSAARLVLVSGLSCAAAARDVGLSRSRVSQVAYLIRRKHAQ